MPSIKPNTRVIEKTLGSPRGSYAVAGHKGLILRTRGDGNGSWTLRYRIGGKQREHTLHNDARNALLAEVLTAKDRWLAQVNLDGIDPKAEREAAIEAATVVSTEDARTYNAAFAAWLDRPREKTLRAASLADYLGVHRCHIEPAFGQVPIKQIGKATLREHFEAAARESRERGKTAKRPERGLQQTKALKQMGYVLSWCVDRDWLDKDPTRGIEAPAAKANPAGKQARPLRDDELQSVWNGLAGAVSPQNETMLRLALLLARRASEIADAPKSELHLTGEYPHWLISPRQGNKSSTPSYVPLEGLALQLIRRAVAISGRSKWLFPSVDDPRRHSSREALSVCFKNYREGLGIVDQVRLHDARGLIVDHMLKMQVPSQIISHVLHHSGDMKSSLAMRDYRTYEFRDEKLRALRLWSIRLQNITSGSRIIPLKW